MAVIGTFWNFFAEPVEENLGFDNKFVGLD